MNETPSIVVLATAWGTRFGGINSFSTDLCRALARVLPGHKVICACESASPRDKEDAQASEVHLVSFDGNFKIRHSPVLDDHKVVDSIVRTIGDGVRWWVGHDAVTGGMALLCAQRCSTSQSAVIMHMSYEDYAYMKYAPTEADTVDRNIENQQTILKGATVGLAVGPLLFERLKEIRPPESASLMLIPGLSDRSLSAPVSSRLHAITYGRFTASESLIKQVELAVSAFARAVRVGFDSKISTLAHADLKLIGATNDVSIKLRQLAEKEAGRVINLMAHDFVEERERLMSWLENCNLCLMLSWHEGFGLSAWEAIGAGVPIVLTKNSGVFKLLDSIGGPAVGCVFEVDVSGRGDGQPNERDIEEAKKAIIEAVSDLPKSLANARALRNHLRRKLGITWDKTAIDLANALGLPVTVTMLDSRADLGDAFLHEPSDVVEGSEVAAAQRVITYAETYYIAGDYTQALNVLEDLKRQPRSYKYASIALDATIVEAEVRLRLNQYPKARSLLEKAALESAEIKDWVRNMRARSVEIMILRDQNQYTLAVDLAKTLHAEAYKRKLAPASLEKAERLLSRSLALVGATEGALEHARVAIKIAQVRQDAGSESKGHFALGEAYRHGGEQIAAAEAYKTARDMAGRIGETDCFLWSLLGLADSLFILGQYTDASGLVKRLEAYVANPGRAHPLEGLHIRLLAASIHCAKGEADRTVLSKLVEDYRLLSITWPSTYVEALLAHKFTTPKRF